MLEGDIVNNIYVFFGEEKVLIEEEVKTSITSTFNKQSEENIATYDLEKESLKELIEDACTLSLFGEKKLIICKNSFFLSSSKETDEAAIVELNKYLKNQNENTIIIFLLDGDKLDARKKIVKEFKKYANLKEFKKMNVYALEEYVKKSIYAKKYKITNEAVSLLVSRSDYNLGIIKNEIDKITIYKGNDQHIDIKDIIELVPPSLNDNIFDLVNAVVDRDIKKILELYNQLLLKNEEPIKIIVTLANQFRLIYQTKRLKKLGFTENQIVSKLDIHPYRIKLASQINLSEKFLIEYIEKLADLDIGIKTGKINKETGLELFFLQL